MYGRPDPKSFIDELVGRADIVELIGARVALKKAGKEFKGCCPFHDEKTASFYVIPDKQFYHCFGCGAHGTAIGFLMNYDHMPFVDAVEELASRLGIEVPREAGSAPTRNTDDDLYSLTKDVAHTIRASSRATRARATTWSGRASRQRRSSASRSATRPIPGTTCSIASARTTLRGAGSPRAVSSSSAAAPASAAPSRAIAGTTAFATA